MSALPIPSTFNNLPLRHAWAYRNPQGDTSGIVGRYQNGTERKDCIPFFTRDGSTWQAGGLPDPRPIFGLEWIAASTDRRAVIVTEGEKCAAALQCLGLPAVTSIGGSKAANCTDWQPLSGFEKCYLLPDHDVPGQAYIRDVFDALSALEAPPVCSIVTLPNLPTAGDVVDWLQSHCPGWDGFKPIPEAERERLTNLFRQAVKDHSAPVPDEWTSNGWEEPIPLDDGALPPWPDDVFPGSIGDFVTGLSIATETPIELPALFALSALSAAVGGKYQVRVKQDYFEPCHAWTCPALVPGSRKTAVKLAVTAPLVKWEREQREAMDADIKSAESERRTLEARIAELRRKASKAKGFEFASLKDEIAAMEAKLPDIPRPPQVFSDDVTSERLGTLLAENNERLAILSDEAGIFENMAGRYSSGIPNLDVYLQAHAGSPVRVDRGSRPSVFLLRPSLTMGISPQPDVLRGLTAKPGFRGRGLLARFLYALPVPNLGKRTGNTRPLSDDLKLRWEGILTRLLNIEPHTAEDGQKSPHTLKLSERAYNLWFAFWREVEADMGPAGRFEFITDWAGKLPGAVARVAGLLHVARHAFDGPERHEISESDMNAAIRIGRTLSVHALAVFNMMGADPAIESARTVLDWIQAERLEGFTFRDCHYAHKHHFRLATELTPVLTVLEERQFIRRAQSPGPRVGRPSRAYEVNPAALL